MAPADLDEPFSEVLRVERWRHDELTRAGYDPLVVDLLASDLRVNLHDALDLIHNGCPQSLVLKILL